MLHDRLPGGRRGGNKDRPEPQSHPVPEIVVDTKGHGIFAHSSLAPRNLSSLFHDTHCLSTGQVKPLKHYVLSPCREIYEQSGPEAIEALHCGAATQLVSLTVELT